MSTQLTKCVIRSMQGVLLLVAIPILVIESGDGCAEINARESLAPTHFSFSVYALSRGKGVPDEARQVLERSRHFFKRAQEQGEVKQIIDRRIGLEGETQVCVEFSNERTANKLFSEIQSLSDGVDLVNVKRETCQP